MKLSMVIFLSLLVATITSWAQGDQNESPERKVKVSGFASQFLISTDFQSMYFNMVGGQIRYFHGDFAVAIAVMPTLRFHRDEHLDPTEDLHPFVTPGFSVGPLFQFKRWMVAFPVSYSYDTRWHPTMGMGYRFGK